MFAIKLIIFILVALLAVYMSVKLGSTTDRRGDKVPTVGVRPIGIFIGIMLIIFTFVFLGCIGQINAGERGVVLKFGAVTGRVLPEGIYAVTPFVNSVETMEVRVQAFHAAAAAVSHDLQEVKTTVTLNYSLSPGRVGKIYQTLGRDFEARIIAPAIQESVKSSTAKFSAEELVTKRAEAKFTIENAIRSRLDRHGIVMETVSITDFDFSPDFKNAVERKVVAQQNYLTEKNNLLMVEQQAQQKIEQAKAEAESLRVQKEQVTPELVDLRRIEVSKAAVDKWNGQLPTYVGGGAPVPIMDIFSQAQGK